MNQLVVDGLEFTFPPTWSAQKYDDWKFYRGAWAKLRDGIKAVDLLVIDPDRTAWMIEAKDYRLHSRTKLVDLAEEIALKLFFTLAGALPAALGANDHVEKSFARRFLRVKRLRVVLHLEQPAVPGSKLFPRQFDLANVQLKLRARIRAVDPHPLVVAMNSMRNVPWKVI